MASTRKLDRAARPPAWRAFLEGIDTKELAGAGWLGETPHSLLIQVGHGRDLVRANGVDALNAYRGFSVALDQEIADRRQQIERIRDSLALLEALSVELETLLGLGDLRTLATSRLRLCSECRGLQGRGRNGCGWDPWKDCEACAGFGVVQRDDRELA